MWNKSGCKTSMLCCSICMGICFKKKILFPHPYLMSGDFPLFILLISTRTSVTQKCRKNCLLSRYLEFKCLNLILSLSDDKLIEVPCSRSDVFKTDSLSLIEKRLLMKFMEFCHNYEEKENEWKG